MQYGTTIGKKFYEDGRVRRYPGNTCVASVTPESDAYEVLCHLKQMLQDSPVSHCYTFLPEDSYHITVINGLNDQVRETLHWPDCLPKTLPMTKVDDHMEKAIVGAGLPDRLHMKFNRLSFGKGAVTVHLTPATPEEEKKLRDFRDRAAKRIGVFFPKHESYVFHISLAYTLLIPEGEWEEKRAALEEKMNEVIRDRAPFFSDKPYMAFFDNMYHFSPERVPRD